MRQPSRSSSVGMIDAAGAAHTVERDMESARANGSDIDVRQLEDPIDVSRDGLPVESRLRPAGPRSRAGRRAPSPRASPHPPPRTGKGRMGAMNLRAFHSIGL